MPLLAALIVLSFSREQLLKKTLPPGFKCLKIHLCFPACTSVCAVGMVPSLLLTPFKESLLFRREAHITKLCLFSNIDFGGKFPRESEIVQSVLCLLANQRAEACVCLSATQLLQTKTSSCLKSLQTRVLNWKLVGN